jgi:predicted transcriptional regulator
LGGTLYGMKKTTVYLDPQTDRSLARLAKAQGLSKAETIRRALEQAVRQVDRPRISAIGVGAGPGDVADDVDRHLDETDFGQR